MILILEDDRTKAGMLMLKYAEEIGDQPVYVTGYVTDAQELLQFWHKGTLTIFLDGELYPGAGFGTDFLRWCLKELLIRSRIMKIIITTGSMMMQSEMETLCQKAGVPYGVSRGLV